MFNDVYRQKKIFVTGHTGFKGSWLVLWLLQLDAHVVGYSLGPPTEPNHHDLLSLDVEAVVADIRNRAALRQSIQSVKPDIVFHLAAQSLVRQSYEDPITTFETNVMGTINVLDACIQTDSVKAIVIVTSDKCYENTGKATAYSENDPMGGYDPYSASKGCAELITNSYRRSFLPLHEYQKNPQKLVASVRAGNIIGGGDWGEDRLIPDVMRAAGQNQKVVLRNPQAVRPWQHVLEPLAGYLLLGQKLLEGQTDFSGAWNFGPDEIAQKTVGDVVQQLQNQWSAIAYKISRNEQDFHEAQLLKLDCSKANVRLGWKPIWTGTTMFANTVQWYREFYESNNVLSQDQLNTYIKNATQEQTTWVMP